MLGPCRRVAAEHIRRSAASRSRSTTARSRQRRSASSSRSRSFPPGSAPRFGASRRSIRELRYPVLVTTGDHPLLTRGDGRRFFRGSSGAGADLTVGLATRRNHPRRLSGRQPHLFCGFGRRPGIGLQSLRAHTTQRALRSLERWQYLEPVRKKPWRLVAAFGRRRSLRYRVGTLDPRAGLRHRVAATRRSIARPVLMPFAEAAIDVDKPADKELAEKILRAAPPFTSRATRCRACCRSTGKSTSHQSDAVDATVLHCRCAWRACRPPRETIASARGSRIAARASRHRPRARRRGKHRSRSPRHRPPRAAASCRFRSAGRRRASPSCRRRRSAALRLIATVTGAGAPPAAVARDRSGRALSPLTWMKSPSISRARHPAAREIVGDPKNGL